MYSFGVLWDLDGVLIDTGEFHYEAWAAILAANKIPFSRDLFRQTFGMNNVGVLTTLLGKPPAQDYADRIDVEKEAAFRAAIHGKAAALPGVIDWLKRLQVMGARQAIASSAPQANIDVLIDELQLRPYFDAVVSAHQMPGKPDPAVFLEAARRIGIAPNRCVVIEDSGAGVTAAKRGGMKCIAVTNTNPVNVLKEAGADLIVDGLDRLGSRRFARLVNTP